MLTAVRAVRGREGDAVRETLANTPLTAKGYTRLISEMGQRRRTKLAMHVLNYVRTNSVSPLPSPLNPTLSAGPSRCFTHPTEASGACSSTESMATKHLRSSHPCVPVRSSLSGAVLAS